MIRDHEHRIVGWEGQTLLDESGQQSRVSRVLFAQFLTLGAARIRQVAHLGAGVTIEVGQGYHMGGHDLGRYLLDFLKVFLQISTWSGTLGVAQVVVAGDVDHHCPGPLGFFRWQRATGLLRIAGWWNHVLNEGHRVCIE